MLKNRNLGLLAPWVLLILACSSDDPADRDQSTDASSADGPFSDSSVPETTPPDGGKLETQPPDAQELDSTSPPDADDGSETDVSTDGGQPETDADDPDADSSPPPDANDGPLEEDGHNPLQARFFRPDSLWNTPISNEPVTFYDIPKIRSGCWWVNYQQYSNPVVFGKSDDPVVTIFAPDTGGWPATELNIHVPSGTTGAPGTDGSLIVISDNIVYDFWQFDRKSDGSATVTAWAQAHIVTGTGWGDPSENKAAGIRAGGSSGLAGEIFGDELTAGIPHALGAAAVIATSGLGGPHRPPAMGGDGSMEGLRLGIPSGTMKPNGLSIQGSNMWNALVTYGAWVVSKADGSCPILFNADPYSVPAEDVTALINDLVVIKDYVRIIDYNYPYNY